MTDSDSFLFHDKRDRSNLVS